MTPTRLGGALLLLLCAAPAGAQSAGDRAPKRASAARVPGGAVRVDGRLDEAAWRLAAPIADFIQKEPTEGGAPTDPMEVRVVFDDEAIYVGARMASADGRIQAPLGRRDDASQAEYLLVSFDTFLDRRTARAFGVTAAGVRLDRFHATDNEDSYDAGFDLVWTAATSVGAAGWTAELWIPFSQLRFNPEATLLWGMNIQRFRPTLDEEDVWVLVPRTVRAWSSRFGELAGIADLPGSRRIEVMPYVAGGSTLNGSRDPADPFDDGRNLTGRVGADLKVGLGPNLTLDAAINPDFGQVEADPAEVNLTAFETRFSEKRPFFLEGASLFNIGHPNFYYSRRIGLRPAGPATADFVDYPQEATILAAAKVTGRLPSRTSVALLGAATDREWASLAFRGQPGTTRVAVAPRASHAVGRVQQEFGDAGSTASLFVNYVHRDFGGGAEALSGRLTRNALGVAGSSLLRFKGGEYELRVSGGGSRIDGDAAAIERVQRSSAHYAQRPDRDYSVLDPTRTSLAGWTAQAAFDRVSGVHWLWGANTKIDSEGFETNDFAILNGADGWLAAGRLTYRETRPGRVFRGYAMTGEVSTDTTLRRLMQEGHVRATANLTWSNYWTTSIVATRLLETTSVSLTRGGPLMGRGPGWSLMAGMGNRSSSETRLSMGASVGGNDDGASHLRASGSVAIRPSPQWRLSVTPFVERLTEPQQYVTTIDGGREATFGRRYVFAAIDRSTVSMQFRVGLTIKPDMNLDVYAEPFAASGRYDDYGELAAPRSRARLRYGEGGTSVQRLDSGSRVVTDGAASFTLDHRDFNTVSFRSNVVLRWEWRPGSTLYVVWQQNRSDTEAVGDAVGVGDAFRSLAAPGRNIFMVKTSLWLGF